MEWGLCPRPRRWSELSMSGSRCRRQPEIGSPRLHRIRVIRSNADLDSGGMTGEGLDPHGWTGDRPICDRWPNSGPGVFVDRAQVRGRRTTPTRRASSGWAPGPAGSRNPGCCRARFRSANSVMWTSVAPLGMATGDERADRVHLLSPNLALDTHRKFSQSSSGRWKNASSNARPSSRRTRTQRGLPT